MDSLRRTKLECKCHIVFISKYRRNVLFGQVRRELPMMFHQLVRQNKSLIRYQEKDDRRVKQLNLV
ncbi:transposase [uncultured Microbulbifer sp.]|uniref:transposase n=1 Tax=uncultured Microbulbifer sp. TaxID=348147 RepID=UPI00344D21FB